MVWVYHILFILLSGDGHAGYFLFLANVSKAAAHVGGQVSVWAPVSIWTCWAVWEPRVHDLLRSCQLSKAAAPFYSPTGSQRMRALISPPSRPLLSACVFDYSPPGGCEVASHAYILLTSGNYCFILQPYHLPFSGMQ